MKYIIRWSREEYGNILVEAKNEQEARELVEMGNYEEKDLVVKSSDMNITDIIELK